MLFVLLSPFKIIAVLINNGVFFVPSSSNIQ